MNTDTTEGVVRSLYDAFARGDIPAVLDLIDPEAELVFEGPLSVPWTGNRRGREGWAKFFQIVGEQLDGVTLQQMTPFAAQGDNVVVAGRYQGRVRSTGKQIDSPLVHLWTVRNGKIVRCQEMTNTAAEAVACTV